MLLAYADWRKNGVRAQRLHEYSFVAITILLTIVYASVHDLITSSISPEYFTAGKGLAGDHLHLRVMWLATQAAIGPGALIGVALVIANNPSASKSQLRFIELLTEIKFPLLGAIVCALLFGCAAFFDILKNHADFSELKNPKLFVTVWGIHWGSYTGGFAGLAYAVFDVLKTRSRTSIR